MAILCGIPFSVWDAVVKNEPEWRLMEPLLGRYGYGHFAVLMLAAGLNDYQLSGRAEKVYWPKIKKLLDNSPTVKSLHDLQTVLNPFYLKERLGSQKSSRLKRFTTSRLASGLWQSRPRFVAENFQSIWNALAQTMRQNRNRKTICFAMKCLGISLLMAGEQGFAFGAIPIPVDLRVMRFMEKAGLAGVNEDEDKVRAFWNNVLLELKRKCPGLTHKLIMIHLDSLIWQIAGLEKNALRRYFSKLGIARTGETILSIIK